MCIAGYSIKFSFRLCLHERLLAYLSPDTVTGDDGRHQNRCRGGCHLTWNMSQCLVRSDTVIYEAANQRPVDELVLTFHLVYRHSSVCQLTARLYLGHLRTPNHWSQRSLTERRSCKHIVNLSGVNGSRADGQHMGPTNRLCKPVIKLCLHERLLAYLSPDTVTGDGGRNPKPLSRRLSAEVEHVPMLATK